MQTVLYVGRMQTGTEVEVRRVHDDFPVEALQHATGVERLVLFIGSGIYAMEVTVGDGDFQDNFHRFLGSPDIQALFQALRPYVQDLPIADQLTADMPLATAMLLWQRSGQGDATTV